MPIAGNLETMNLAELLQWLGNGRQTGTLVVSNGSIEKKIFLRDGAVLSSASSDPRGFLGHFLVSKGVISEDDLAKAMSLQATQGGLLGEILVEGGAIDQEMLDHMLRLKAEENIYDLFAWEEGTFKFRDDELPDYELVPISANITGLVLEGIRRLDHAKEIEKLIPSMQCVPVAVGSLKDDDEMDYGWLGVLEAVDDDRSVEDICLHTHSSEFFVCDVLYAKVREGKIKIVRPRVIEVSSTAPVTPVPEAEQDQPTSPRTGSTPAPKPTDAETHVSEAVSHIKVGAHDIAVRHIAAARSLDSQNPELVRVVKELETEVVYGLENDGVRFDKIPVLQTTLDDLRAMSFSPEEGFILSRINGSSDIASIVKISPLSEMESLLVFWKLMHSGQITLEDAS
ncbi:MAG: DUF4388 domain-containing protein [Acidobacteria bacterium]|nr:DUF4388 domain-containing protein [Acidobacteriota bacterium]